MKRGSVDGVMGFLAAYQSKLSQLDEQWELYSREKKALTEQINVLRKNAQDLNPVTVKEAKVNKYVYIVLYRSLSIYYALGYG